MFSILTQVPFHALLPRLDKKEFLKNMRKSGTLNYQDPVLSAPLDDLVDALRNTSIKDTLQRADLYSLGITLWYILVGFPMYDRIYNEPSYQIILETILLIENKDDGYRVPIENLLAAYRVNCDERITIALKLVVSRLVLCMPKNRPSKDEMFELYKKLEDIINHSTW